MASPVCLYQQFAITIAISVAISSINALTLSPALAASLLKPPGEEATSTFDRFFRAFNERFETGHRRSSWCLTGYFTNKLLRAGALLAMLIVGLVLLFQIVPAGFVPEEDQGYVMTGWSSCRMPRRCSARQVSCRIKDGRFSPSMMRSRSYTTAIAGFSMLTNTTQSNAGLAFIQLK